MFKTTLPARATRNALYMPLALCALVTAVFSTSVIAQPSPEDARPRTQNNKASDSGQTQGHRRPPREAVQACQQKKAGDACSFTGREGAALQGTCSAPEGKPPACKPAGHPAK